MHSILNYLIISLRDFKSDHLSKVNLFSNREFNNSRKNQNNY